MSLLGRLSGREPPRVPDSGRAFASMDDMDGTRWSVRVQMPGQEPTLACLRLSPVFHQQETAYAYLAWVTGEAATFSYPDGEA